MDSGILIIRLLDPISHTYVREKPVTYGNAS
jgi:hypothetical protein